MSLVCEVFTTFQSHLFVISDAFWLDRRGDGGLQQTVREEESHITSGSCEVYGDLKAQLGDWGEDKNLVEFFRAVLDRRDELDKEDRQEKAAEDRQQQAEEDMQKQVAAAVIARPGYGDMDRTSRLLDWPPFEPK